MQEFDTSLMQAGPVHLSWPADPHCLTHVRSAVRTWLAPLGFASDAIEDIVLATNEAASNAIDHAYSTISSRNTVELRLCVDHLAAHVEILDHGQWRTPDPRPTGRGLGLQIMQHLTDAVIVHHGPPGTIVLLRSPLPR